MDEGTVERSRQALGTGHASSERSHSLLASLVTLGWGIFGRTLLRYLRYRHWGLMRQLRPLAIHLEEVTFPQLREQGRDWAELLVPEQTEPLNLADSAGHEGRPLPGTERVAEALHESGIRLARLDRRLESNQVAEAVLLLRRLAPLFPRPATSLP